MIRRDNKGDVNLLIVPSWVCVLVRGLLLSSFFVLAIYILLGQGHSMGAIGYMLICWCYLSDRGCLYMRLFRYHLHLCYSVIIIHYTGELCHFLALKPWGFPQGRSPKQFLVSVTNRWKKMYIEWLTSFATWHVSCLLNIKASGYDSWGDMHETSLSLARFLTASLKNVSRRLRGHLYFFLVQVTGLFIGDCKGPTSNYAHTVWTTGIENYKLITIFDDEVKQNCIPI